MKTSWAEILEHPGLLRKQACGEVLQLGGAERENLRKENLRENFDHVSVLKL